VTDIVEDLRELHVQATTQRSHYYVAACASRAIVEIEKLRNLAADLMYLLDELPIKHPQQAAVRNILREQCNSFIHPQEKK
jgi:hypothetical protein